LFTPGRPKPAQAQTDELVDRLWSSRDALVTHLEARMSDVRRLAARNFEVLGELLDEGRTPGSRQS
ncbi:MAG: hypothetical protein JO165_10535, partial [Candidatus Eremiobacteraeota bacterium]|nr:hypothetical protein [Candidatus Eremiobacteraeota bacterium]